MCIIVVTKLRVATVMKFDSKQEEIRFLSYIWLRLLYLYEHIKYDGDTDLKSAVRKCKNQISIKIDELKDQI